jgi:hypothetical protein
MEKKKMKYTKLRLSFMSVPKILMCGPGSIATATDSCQWGKAILLFAHLEMLLESTVMGLAMLVPPLHPLKTGLVQRLVTFRSKP